ncbi:unnamed protein product, partial [Brenthis ino]
MISIPIPATAANLIKTNQLRRRYYSAQVYAQTQRTLSIPVTLILRWDDSSTRPVKVLIILLLFGVQLYCGEDIAKIEFDNGKEVYEIRELQNKSVEFINPKEDIPILREILFYKVIEKPYIQETNEQVPIIEKSKDEQDKQEPVFDETRRSFTNGHGFQFSNGEYQDEDTHNVENKNTYSNTNDNNLSEGEHKDVDDNDDKDHIERDKNDNVNDKFDDNYSSDNDNAKNDTTHDKNDDMFEYDDDTEDSNKKQLNSNNEIIKKYGNYTDDDQNGNNTNANETNYDTDDDNIGKTNITREDVNDENTKEDKIPEEELNLVKKLRAQLLNSTKEKYHSIQRLHETEKKERRKREVNYRNIPEAPRLPDLDVKSFPSYIQRMLANRPIFGNDEKSNTKNEYDTSLIDKMSGIFPPDNTASGKAKTYGFKYNQAGSASWNDLYKTQNHHKSNVPNVLDLSGSQTNNPYQVQKPTIDIRDNIIPEGDETLNKNKKENYQSPINIIPSLDINLPAEKDHDEIKKYTEGEKHSNTESKNKENVNTNYIDNGFDMKDRLIDMLHNIDSKLSNGKKPKTYGMSLKNDKGEIWNDIAGVPSMNIDNTHNEDALENESINDPNKISNIDYVKEDNVNNNKDNDEKTPNIFESANEPNKINNFNDAREVMDSFHDDNKKELDNYDKSNPDEQRASIHEVNNNAEKTPYKENLFNVPPPAPKNPDFKFNEQFITSTNKPEVSYKRVNEIVQHTTGIPSIPYFTQRSTEKSIEVTEKPKIEESKIEKEHQPIDNEDLRHKIEESFDNIIKQFPKLEPMREETTGADVSKKNDVRNNNNKPRTYGMHLEGDHGDVWNDLTNPGTHVNVGDLENMKVTEPSVDEVIPNSNIVENHSESPIQTTQMNYEKKSETTTNKNDEEITEEPTTTTTEKHNVTEEKNNGTTQRSKDNELDNKKDCNCKNDTLNKDKAESVNNNNETEPIKVTLDDLLKKDEFWQWLSNWTTTYMDVLNERVEKLVDDKVAKYFENNDKKNNNDEVDPDKKNNKNNDTIKINKETDDNENDDSSKKVNIDEHKTNNNNSKINNDDMKKSNKTDIETGKDIINSNETGTDTEKSDLEPISKDNINSTDDDMSKKKNNSLPFNIKSDTIYGNTIDSDHVTNIFVFYPNVKLNKTIDQLEPLINKTNSDISVIAKPANVILDERIGISEDDKDNQINKPHTSTEISSSTQSNTETIIGITSTTESPTTTEELAKGTPKGIEESKNKIYPKPSNDHIIDLKEPEKATKKMQNDNQITTETPKSDHNETTTDATNTENIKKTTKLSDKEATTESIKKESEKETTILSDKEVTTELPKTETTKLNDKETTTESIKTEKDKVITKHDDKEITKHDDKEITTELSETENNKQTTKPDDSKTATPSSVNNDNNVTTTDKSEITTESSTDKPSDSNVTEKSKDSKDTSDVTTTEKSTGS